MRPLKNSCEVAVIGGGLTGLSAARQAARLGRLVTLFENSGIFGGQVATVGHVDGLPFPGDFSGQDLAVHLLEELRKVGVHLVETRVQKLAVGRRLDVIDQDNNTYHPNAIIIASGGSLRKLGVAGEEKLTGRGVSRCATCDGGFFRGQDVVVVGGGDGAVHEALELSRTSRRVIMVCRSALKAKREYIDKLAGKDNVSFIWDCEVCEIIGDDAVGGVRLRNVKDGQVSEVECAGVFPFVGVSPNSDFVPSALLTATGHIETDRNFASADPRVFAAGAVRADFDGTAVQAMAEGTGAAAAASRLLLQ